VCVFFITATLIAGMAGCVPASQNVEIQDWYDLDAVRDNLSGSFILMNDLDLTTAGYQTLASPSANGGKGWRPIGTRDEPFIGTFDGQGHEIRDLFIIRPDERYVGLFGRVREEGVITNIALMNFAVTGDQHVGGLVGSNDEGSVLDCFSAGDVSGREAVGGLAGSNYRGTVSVCYSTGSVNGTGFVGGLVGYINYDGKDSVISSHSSANVTGENYHVGGLVGTSEDGGVRDSYSSGDVAGNWCVGGLVGVLVSESGMASVRNCHSTSNVIGYKLVAGLVGSNSRASVSNSYATGDVTGNLSVGGLVGVNSEDATVSNSYSAGSIIGYERVGGLVGWNLEANVSDSYATGNVSGNLKVGGLVGYNQGNVSKSYSVGKVTGNVNVGGLVGLSDEYQTVNNSFWDTETSEQATSDGGTGKTTAEMKDIDTFSGAAWNIINVALNETIPAYIWNIVDDVIYPFLSWQSVS